MLGIQELLSFLIDHFVLKILYCEELIQLRKVKKMGSNNDLRILFLFQFLMELVIDYSLSTI